MQNNDIAKQINGNWKCTTKLSFIHYASKAKGKSHRCWPLTRFLAEEEATLRANRYIAIAVAAIIA